MKSEKMRSRLIFVFGLYAFCALAQSFAIEVRVAGMVKGARINGEYGSVLASLQENSSILDAIAYAGGIYRAGVVQRVILTRMHVDGSREVFKDIDLIAALCVPDSAIRLKDGDTVYVPERLMDGESPHIFNQLLFEWAYWNQKGQPYPRDWSDTTSELCALYRNVSKFAADQYQKAKKP